MFSSIQYGLLSSESIFFVFRYKDVLPQDTGFERERVWNVQFISIQRRIQEEAGTLFVVYGPCYASVCSNQGYVTWSLLKRPQSLKISLIRQRQAL